MGPYAGVIMRERAATRALVLGLLALPFGILAPIAIWTGAGSLRRIRSSNGELTGKGAAFVGLGAGVAASAFIVAGVAYWWLGS